MFQARHVELVVASLQQLMFSLWQACNKLKQCNEVIHRLVEDMPQAGDFTESLVASLP
jgi:hypothetical protein